MQNCMLWGNMGPSAANSSVDNDVRGSNISVGNDVRDFLLPLLRFFTPDFGDFAPTRLVVTRCENGLAIGSWLADKESS
jgi:hypothetical protein